MYQIHRPKKRQSPVRVFLAVILSLVMGMVAALALLFTFIFAAPVKKLRL